MATFQLPILNHSLNLDAGVYPSTLAAELSLTNSKATQVIVMPFPNGADIGLMGRFTIPQNYVGTPQIVAKLIWDGTPANTVGFGMQQVCVTDSETRDVAYEAEDVANIASWTGYADEEGFTLTITLTPTATYAAGKEVYFYFYSDDSVDTRTVNLLLEDLLFQYADA